MTPPWAEAASPFNSFVGREAELADAGRLLGRSRLVTLVGPGGAGKTRLALQFADGVSTPHERCWFVDLSASASGKDEVTEVTAAAVGVSLGRSADAAAALAEEIGSEPALLVMDNCEHLVESVAVLIAKLLNTCAGLKVLATSQRVIGVPGEVLFPVRGFSMSEPGTGDWATTDAVRLFTERAREIDSGFTVTPEVAEICRRLDGMPLSIELAARWAGTLSPAEILSELVDHRFELLTSTATAPGRHSSLLTVIERTYHLLDESEQKLLRRLSILPGPFDMDTATAVGTLDGAPRVEVMQLVRQLMMKSLLAPQREASSEPAERRSRFRMLESIREFGLAKLAESGEVKTSRSHLVEWYASLCEPIANPDAFVIPASLTKRLTIDRENLQAVTEWAREAGDDRSHLLLGCTLGHAWAMLSWFDRCAELIGSLSAPADDNVLRCLLAYCQVRAAIEIADYNTAALHADELESIASSSTDLVVYQLRALWCRALITSHDQTATAAGYQARLIELAEATGHVEIAAKTKSTLAWRLINKGDGERATFLIESALPILRTCSSREDLAFALNVRGVLALDTADFTFADRCFREALGMIGVMSTVHWFCYGGLVLVAAKQKDHVRALRLAGAIDQLPRRSRTQHAPEFLQRLDEAQNGCNAALKPDKANKAVRDGKALSREEAVDYALNGIWPKRLTETEDSPLTARENEVVKLVTEGMTNKQIATRLSLSSRTVEAHLENVRGKLGLQSRTQVSAWYAKRQASESGPAV